ncbi:SH3 and PX domain-containing protein 2A-like [Ostrea edulis]|uniref:SH3 and PX domain-containing protein 2A-like n=1 Tax=Ostrea edulis TaxID=37623 RepID=UPI0020948847|nr:SH3 and PX domain-containing protein 2A-like [Ostrea edulis]
MSLKVLGTNVNIKYVDTRCDMEEDFTVCSNLFVTSLTVSGFVEIAGPSGKEYIFVIDVTWSDNRSLTVKRTYKDFLNFRSKLLNAVKRVKCDVNIPELQGYRIFRRYDRKLAEEREEELQKFANFLLNGDRRLRHLATVVDFFEPQPTDPVPYRSPPDGACDSDAEDPFAENIFDRKWMKRK